MQGLRLGAVLMLILSLGGCLEPNPVSPLSPKPQGQTASSVTFSLPRTALADLALTAEQLVIAVNKVEGGAIGVEAHEPFKFALTEAGLYALEGLPLGELSFSISLLDGIGQTLAEGTLRAVINLGQQTLPSLVLKPKKPTPVALGLQVGISLINFPNSTPVIPAEPAAVRSILTSFSCASAGCHSAAKMKGGLNLQDYPYKNMENETLAAILGLISDSLTASNGVPKMPPTSKVAKAEEVATIQSFLQAVNDADKASSDTWIKEVKLSLSLGGPSRLESALLLKDGSYILDETISLQAGARYAYSLTIMGPNGSKLYEVTDGALDVPLDGRVALKIDVTYQAPVVTLPVTVQPTAN